MQIERLRSVLEKSDSVTSKEKAINSRISKANSVEEILGENLDLVIKDDRKMYEALMKLKESPKEHNGCLQNSLRWYYKAINEKDFPKLEQYRKQNRI